MIDLQKWITHPEMLDKESLYTLRNLLARYPYFQTARLLYLKNLYLLHDPSFGEELCHSVIYITNRSFLYHFVEGELKSGFRKKSAETVPGGSDDRTLAIIDAFLASVPEEPSLATVDNEVATDYTSYLLQEEGECRDESGEEPSGNVAPLRGQSLIDRFIEKADEGSLFHSKPERDGPALPPDSDEMAEEEAEEEESEDDSCFTETLAKIYIKQHRYAKALEIIKKLSLKYPKKSTYFAEQIKYLENLIINTNSKK